jgi:hypothetical protein
MTVKTPANYATTVVFSQSFVVPVASVPISIITQVLELATQKIELEWRPIMNWYEHSELKMYDYIKIQSRSSRQTLFENIKYSDFGEHTFYQGGWGAEPLIWSVYTEQGYVWSTEARQEEIQQWVRDTVFRCAPGNE